jgi:hypothetical protein
MGRPFVARVGLSIAAALLWPGCEKIANRVNDDGADRDVGKLVRKHGVAAADLRCKMIGPTRGATCTTAMTVAESAALVKALALAPTIVAPHAMKPAAAGCRAQVAFVGADVHMTTNKALVGFDYFALFTTGAAQVCIEVQYGYG